MKILFISDNAINGFGGGSIENKKYYSALKKYCINNNYEFKVISMDKHLDEMLEISIKKNKFLDILARALGHSSFLYFTFIRNKKNIISYNPDILVLGRSRFGFIAKAIKKRLPSCKIISNVDNVELDYVEAYFAKEKGIKGRILKFLEKRAVLTDEKDCINYSDKLIYLTKRNVRRYQEIYEHFEENPSLLPICIEKPIELVVNSEKKTVVFIGSLDYAPNHNAVKTIVSEVWDKNFADNNTVELIVAGRNPSDELTNLLQQYRNVKLVSNFNNLSDFVPINSLMLAPIEEGAGMKVKVAESLSMGSMIAASDEALVGYEDAIVSDKLKGITRANKANEYKNAIDAYIIKTDKQFNDISEQNKNIYQKYYSYDVSNATINIVLESLVFK